MGDVNLQLVREFFELNMFMTFTHLRAETQRTRVTERGPQLFVVNTATQHHSAPDFVLRTGDIPTLHRAVVEVRAWHGDRFYPSVIESNPVLFQVADDATRSVACEVFGSEDFTTILVVSELPASTVPRERAIQVLRQGGIGHVLEFPTVLRELLDKVSSQESYAVSNTLQTLRILKRYGFIRRQQLEFSFPGGAQGYLPITSAEPRDPRDDLADVPVPEEYPLPGLED